MRRSQVVQPDALPGHNDNRAEPSHDAAGEDVLRVEPWRAHVHRKFERILGRDSGRAAIRARLRASKRAVNFFGFNFLDPTQVHTTGGCLVFTTGFLGYRSSYVCEIVDARGQRAITITNEVGDPRPGEKGRPWRRSVDKWRRLVLQWNRRVEPRRCLRRGRRFIWLLPGWLGGVRGIRHVSRRPTDKHGHRLCRSRRRELLSVYGRVGCGR